MMDLTDRHARYFLRLLSRHALLYTEMITTGALIHGDTKRFLRFDPAEHPVAIQLGGIDPNELATCARMAEAEGYDEINLNVGCPSDRVQAGRFGACLMAEPHAVAVAVGAMRAAVSIPITVKTRIGLDRDETGAQLAALVEAVRQTGSTTFIVHARNAWLKGLSPKENREIPPLRYEVVHRLKAENPDLKIVVNGGISSLEQIAKHLEYVDGVMLGREAYYNPYLLAGVDRALYESSAAIPTRASIVEQLLPYLRKEMASGTPLAAMTRHIIALYHGLPGARRWRRTLSERAQGADVVLVSEALQLVEEEIRRSRTSTALAA